MFAFFKSQRVPEGLLQHLQEPPDAQAEPDYHLQVSLTFIIGYLSGNPFLWERLNELQY